MQASHSVLDRTQEHMHSMDMVMGLAHVETHLDVMQQVM
jgi:hypothetical protein